MRRRLFFGYMHRAFYRTKAEKTAIAVRWIAFFRRGRSLYWLEGGRTDGGRGHAARRTHNRIHAPPHVRLRASDFFRGAARRPHLFKRHHVAVRARVRRRRRDVRLQRAFRGRRRNRRQRRQCGAHHESTEHSLSCPFPGTGRISAGYMHAPPAAHTAPCPARAIRSGPTQPVTARFRRRRRCSWNRR